MGNVLIGLYLALFAWLSWRNISWGIYSVCAFLPAYLIRFSVIELPSTMLEGMIVLLFIVWLIKEKISLNPLAWFKNLANAQVAADKNNLVPKIVRWPIILLLIAGTISVFVSPSLRASAGLWKAYFIEPIMFLLVLVYNIKDAKEIKNIIRALGFSALALSIFAFYQKITGSFIDNPFWADVGTRRVTGFFEYPNALDLFLGPIILLLAGIIIYEKKSKWQFLYWPTLALSVMSVVWAKSTGALIALAIGILAWLIFYKKTRLSALIIACAAILIFIFTPAVQNKISSELFLASQSRLPIAPSDLAVRTQMWRETWAMLKERPILGAGLAGYQTAVAPFHANSHIEIFLYPHNIILNFWTEAGILGLTAFIWLIIAFFILSSKTPKNPLTFASISAMMAILVHGLVDAPYFKNDLAVEFWLIIGIIIILYNQKNLGRVA